MNAVLRFVLASVERTCLDAVLGDDAADVDVVDPLLSQDVNQQVAAWVLGFERRPSGGVAAFVEHRLDDLFSDQVGYWRAEDCSVGPFDAMWRPGIDVVGLV